MDMISYYDVVSEKMKECDQLNQELGFAPRVFGNFDSPGGYGGIKLTVKLLKECFLQYMASFEDYFQALFQGASDEGIATDHTHKFLKEINLNRWKGEGFKASYTVMNQKGLVCMNRLTNTKGAQLLTNLVADYKECQNLKSVGPLKMFMSDCLNIDGGLWERTFQQELNENVVPYKGTSSSNLPLLSIDDDGYEYI